MEDLGEDAFPEEAPKPAEENGHVKTVQNLEPAPTIPEESTTSSPSTTSSTESQEGTQKKDDPLIVTTEERKPLEVPSSVHVRINSGNLKDYVGPPVYHKDRMYVKAPPPGVSTGLGYLGNGSGAVMPVEAMVSHLMFFLYSL